MAQKNLKPQQLIALYRAYHKASIGSNLVFPAVESAYTDSQLYHYLFLAIFLVYYLGALVINPTINFLLKSNYEHQHFGKLYSYATSVNKVVMLVITFCLRVVAR